MRPGTYPTHGRSAFGAALLACALVAQASTPRTVDVPSRPGVTQRILVIKPDKPLAAVVLFAGGDGNIQAQDDGSVARGGNFLVRSRELFSAGGLLTVVIDVPSDKQSHPYLSGNRQTAEHVADVKAVIAWLRQQANIPVWLVGTSRGTQSVAYAATQLPRDEGGPDGIVLTATMLTDRDSRAVPEMDLDRLRIPVLVVHHRNDACRHTLLRDMPRLMERLTTPPRKELIVVEGGDTTGDSCGARAYHGFNNTENEVVKRIAAWITAR
ncbi:MAG: alpha/beta hydrolase [Burkholderiales bacterium]|nr:alpha/beta hydrolase [Burkholderiales bacterium]